MKAAQLGVLFFLLGFLSAPRALAQVWDGEDLSLSATGGTVTTSNGFLSITAPAGAVAVKTTVYIRPNHLAPDTPSRFISPAMSLTMGTTKLAKAVTLVYHFNPAELPTGFSTSSARLFKVVGHRWTLVPSTVNTATNDVTANVTSLGTFAVFASTVAVPAENAILYMNPQDGSVYRYRLDTGDNQYLSGLRVSDGAVIWSPTEDMVIFGHDLASGLDVFAANIDHTGVHKLSTLSASNANSGSISPDGTVGAFSAQVGTAWGVYKFSITGGAPTLFASGGSTAGPMFSQDGTKIAYADGTTITVRNASTGALIKTLTPGGTNIGNVVFNPAGTAVSFSMQATDLTQHLYTQAITSTTAVSRTVNGLVNLSKSAWSPDGTMIAVYVQNVGICIISATKTNQGLLTTLNPNGPVEILWR